MKAEHVAELEGRRSAETRLRSLESQVAMEKVDMREMARKLEKEEEENKQVRELERVGERQWEVG